MWYPIDTIELPAAPVEGGDNVPIAIKPEDAPKGEELTDWIQSEKDLDIKQTLSLGFAPFSFDQSGDHRTIVLDEMHYLDKGNVRWGVGMRLTLHAWTEQGTVKGAVALVAAQASLNLAYTRASFQVLGCKSPDLSAHFPGFEEMNVSSYSKLMKSLDDCKSVLGAAIEAGHAVLEPKAIAVSLPAPSPKEDGSYFWKFHIHHK
jgi:hypothetical protein